MSLGVRKPVISWFSNFEFGSPLSPFLASRPSYVKRPLSTLSLSDYFLHLSFYKDDLCSLHKNENKDRLHHLHQKARNSKFSGLAFLPEASSKQRTKHVQKMCLRSINDSAGYLSSSLSLILIAIHLIHAIISI